LIPSVNTESKHFKVGSPGPAFLIMALVVFLTFYDILKNINQ